jgi:hypothetical protein
LFQFTAQCALSLQQADDNSRHTRGPRGGKVRSRWSWAFLGEGIEQCGKGQLTRPFQRDWERLDRTQHVLKDFSHTHKKKLT